MSVKWVSVALALVHLAAAMPALTLEDLEIADDTMSVGSYIRETRAAAPEDYHKSYQNEGDGEIGYSRKKSGGGKKGYQHFDSYHKKAGDNYEFEKQDSYGLDEGNQHGAHSHNHETKGDHDNDGKDEESPKNDRYRREPSEDDSYRGAVDHESYREPLEKERIREPEAEDIDEVNQRASDKRSDDKHPHYEELKEGANDGNGGVEAIGHDPADYVLPEKYVYGNGEEYNF